MKKIIYLLILSVLSVAGIGKERTATIPDEITLLEFEAGVYPNFTGNVVDYYEDGTLMLKGISKEGKLNGVWVEYDENGNISSKGSYQDGKQNGEWIWYDKNNNIILKGRFTDGKEDGDWTWYDLRA